MRNVISAGFKLTAIASFGFWWLWLLGGASYYYLMEHSSLWNALTSGAGISLAVSVGGIFSAFCSEKISG